MAAASLHGLRSFRQEHNTSETDFEEVWGRYLPPATPIAATADEQIDTNDVPVAEKGAIDRLPGNIAVYNDELIKNASVTPDRVLPTKFSENRSPGHQCYRVTDERPT